MIPHVQRSILRKGLKRHDISLDPEEFTSEPNGHRCQLQLLFEATAYTGEPTADSITAENRANKHQVVDTKYIQQLQYHSDPF